MKSYIKFLSRNKLYTAIEAVGLAVSLAFVILIGTYVWQQYQIAYEHADYENIYAVSGEDMFGVGYLDKETIDGAVPEVEASVRISGADEVGVVANGETYLASPSYLDKEFFDLFPYYEIIEGTVDVLDDPSNVIVSRTFANKLSTDGSSVIGMQLRYPDKDDKVYTVAAVMEDWEKTLFHYSDLVFNIRETGLEQYGFNTIGSVATFVKVKEGTDREALLEKLKPLYYNNYKDWVKLVLYRLDETYFCEDAYMVNRTSESMLRLLLIVVLALLVSAVLNYINLSFALTGKRAKEMATRRLIGANRSDIFLKCILESVAFTLVCFVVAILLALALVPMMNSLLVGDGLESAHVPLTIDLTPGYLLVCVFSAVVLGVIVGLMPALNTLSFKPIDVIKGSFRRRDKMVFTKVFIVIQNTLSMILITMGILMEVQLSHMMSRPVNANMDNLYFLMGNMNPSQGQALIDRLERLPEVKTVGVGSGFPGRMNMGFGVRPEDDQPTQMIQIVICDSTYFKLISPEIVEDFNYPLHGSIWMGESTVAAIDVQSANNLCLAGNFNVNGAVVNQVGGIFKDIPTGPPTELDLNEKTAFIVQRPENIKYNFSLLVSTVSESKEVEDKIMDEYYAVAEEIGIYDPPYLNIFLSDSIREDLAPAIRAIRLIELFMILSVLLSSLGLIAMSTYFSEQKSKDIAVRKVFGGTVCSEALNNVRSYMMMVLVARVIGVPIAIYASERYIELYHYRVENIWWVFVLAVLLSFAISLLSVLWQTLKAARKNPATELKKE